jgi:hypothetical protein
MYKVIDMYGQTMYESVARTNAMQFAEKHGYDRNLPENRQNVYIVKVRENYVRTPMRCKSTKSTWDMKTNVRNDYV